MAGKLSRRKATEYALGVLGPGLLPVFDREGQLVERPVSFRRSCALDDDLDVGDSSSFHGQMGILPNRHASQDYLGIVGFYLLQVTTTVATGCPSNMSGQDDGSLARLPEKIAGLQMSGIGD